MRDRGDWQLSEVVSEKFNEGGAILQAGMIEGKRRNRHTTRRKCRDEQAYTPKRYSANGYITR